MKTACTPAFVKASAGRQNLLVAALVGALALVALTLRSKGTAPGRRVENA